MPRALDCPEPVGLECGLHRLEGRIGDQHQVSQLADRLAKPLSRAGRLLAQVEMMLCGSTPTRTVAVEEDSIEAATRTKAHWGLELFLGTLAGRLASSLTQRCWIESLEPACPQHHDIVTPGQSLVRKGATGRPAPLYRSQTGYGRGVAHGHGGRALSDQYFDRAGGDPGRARANWWSEPAIVKPSGSLTSKGRNRGQHDQT